MLLRSHQDKVLACGQWKRYQRLCYLRRNLNQAEFSSYSLQKDVHEINIFFTCKICETASRGNQSMSIPWNMLLWKGICLGLIRRMNSRQMVRQSSAFGSCQAQLTSNVEAWNEDATKQDPDFTQSPEFRPIKQELIRLLMEKHQSLMELHSNVLKSPEEHNSSKVCQVSEIQHFESFRGNLHADMKIMTPGEDHEVSEFWRHGRSVEETTYPIDPH